MTLLEAALDYAARGVPILPLKGKKPVTVHGLNDASANAVTICTWWEQWPNANVGIPTGRASGLWVLDIDPRHGGDKSLADLEAKFGSLPSTLEGRTGGGGRHLFFALSNGEMMRNSVGKLGSGLDVRGEGGYVVVPPSIHPDTQKPYAWENETKPAAAPAWLVQKLSIAIPPIESISDASILNGQRNDTLTRIAGAMRRHGCTQEAILAALHTENARRCNPLLADSEVRAIAQSVSRYAPEPQIESLAPCVLAKWPDPSPLGDELPPVQAFAHELLPTSFLPLVEDISERMQTPMDYAAASLIVALAACVNRRAVIQPKAEDTLWHVVPNLWGAIIGPPGMLKSPILHAATSPLNHIEDKWRAEFQSAYADFEFEKEHTELRYQAWRETFKLAVKKGQAEPIQPDKTLCQPARQRLVLADATFEKLHEILQENPAGVLVLRDELTGWLATLDKQGREGERSFFLQAWNGDGAFTVDRIGRGSIHVPAVCVSLLGAIQPARLRWYLSDTVTGGPNDDGLIQRFQILVWPDCPRDWKLIDRPPNYRALITAEKVLSRLAHLCADSPLKMRFDRDSQQLFFEWLAELESKVRGNDELHPAIIAHLSKYRSLMPSLAGLFELADRAAGVEDLQCEITISLQHAKQAAALCEYLESHARRVYACVVSPQIRAARELARHIHAGDLDNPFKTRDVYLKGWSGLDDVDRARSAIGVLEDVAWLRREDTPALQKGGRPPEVWRINPKVARREK